MITFPEQRIAREAPVEKLWRWLTAKGWSWDVNDKYQSLTVKNGETLRIPIFFDRHEIKTVDVFQIWLMNAKASLSLWQRFVTKLKSLRASVQIYHGYFDLYIDGKWARRHFVGTGASPDWGTNLMLNFDDSEILNRAHVIFDVRYFGYPLFIKSLELYAVIVPTFGMK